MKQFLSEPCKLEFHKETGHWKTYWEKITLPTPNPIFENITKNI